MLEFVILSLFWLEACLCTGSLLRPCNDTNVKYGSFCHLNDTYDKSLPSTPYPNKVDQFFIIHEIIDFDPEYQTVTFFLKCRMEWNDTRISTKRDPDEVNWTWVDEEFAKEIFFPTLSIYKAKHVKVVEQVSTIDYRYFWHHKNGPHHFEMEQNMMVTIVCSFDFSSFPFDHHSCNFEFGFSLSQGFLLLTPTTIIYRESNTRFGHLQLQYSSHQIPFDVTIVGLEPFGKLKFEYNYSHAGFQIILKRNRLGTLLGSFYLPTGIFASLSLVSFSINPDMVRPSPINFHTSAKGGGGTFFSRGPPVTFAT